MIFPPKFFVLPPRGTFLPQEMVWGKREGDGERGGWVRGVVRGEGVVRGVQKMP